METVLFIYLITVSLEFILKEKIGVHKKLMQSKSKILFRLGKCDFCFFFWAAAISTLAWYIVHDVWLVPFAVAGLFSLITDFKTDEND